MINLTAPLGNIDAQICLPRSKSESNRALLLQKLAQNIDVLQLSDADDSQIMQNLLTLSATSGELNVGAAGTVMRFMTAFCALQAGKTYRLFGTNRMHERPISPLVDALLSLGADIEYTEKIGFPPLLINGKMLRGGEVQIAGNMSSQYISALMMIAPCLADGLIIQLSTPLISASYAEMTAQMMRHFGAVVSISDNQISVASGGYDDGVWSVESDWSAASYWYAVLAFAPAPARIRLDGLKADSLQPDAACVDIFRQFGVVTTFDDLGATIQKLPDWTMPDYFQHDFSRCPDIAQTLAVVCAGLGIAAELRGLQTLRIKETDRIAALSAELQKLHSSTQAGADYLHIFAGKIEQTNDIICTYHDHRMAMAFAPLALVVGNISIQNPDVVGKSFPHFWREWARL
jgi:3-phosphoshikimate 1-carboxyvinyltransferase